jgi:uncharacterized protein (DUF2062 family)
VTDEESNLRRVRHMRIRRVKRLLRPLPRRANVHRYPVLKWFHGTARKRCYLWSFRPGPVVAALYLGCILAMLPIYGFQLLLGFFAALVFRANLMLVVALVLITNPVTFVPLYAADFAVGNAILGLVSEPPRFEVVEWIRRIPEFFESPARYLDYLQARGVASKLPYFFGALTVGGFILGGLMGLVSHGIYLLTRRQLARRMRFLEEQVRRVTHLHLPIRKSRAPFPANPDPEKGKPGSRPPLKAVTPGAKRPEKV